jgi:DNA-binding response OmpR family regulator
VAFKLTKNAYAFGNRTAIKLIETPMAACAQTLRVTVSNLRRKLASDAGHVLPIVAEPGVGYRLRSDSAYPCSVFFAQAK